MPHHVIWEEDSTFRFCIFPHALCAKFVKYLASTAAFSHMSPFTQKLTTLTLTHSHLSPTPVVKFTKLHVKFTVSLPQHTLTWAPYFKYIIDSLPAASQPVCKIHKICLWNVSPAAFPHTSPSTISLHSQLPHAPTFNCSNAASQWPADWRQRKRYQEQLHINYLTTQELWYLIIKA